MFPQLLPSSNYIYTHGYGQLYIYTYGVYIYIYPYQHPYLHQFMYIIYIYLSICLSIFLSIYLSIHPSIHLSIYLLVIYIISLSSTNGSFPMGAWSSFLANLDEHQARALSSPGNIKMRLGNVWEMDLPGKWLVNDWYYRCWTTPSPSLLRKKGKDIVVPAHCSRAPH